MKYASTRSRNVSIDLSNALIAGLASDGGLYVPQTLPSLSAQDFVGLESIAAIATRLLHPFFEGDPLADDLEDICIEAFDFPAPLKPLTLRDLSDCVPAEG